MNLNQRVVALILAPLTNHVDDLVDLLVHFIGSFIVEAEAKKFQKVSYFSGLFILYPPVIIARLFIKPLC